MARIVRNFRRISLDTKTRQPPEGEAALLAVHNESYMKERIKPMTLPRMLTFGKRMGCMLEFSG
ncbi:hypothetical protein DFP95_10698 [Cohnella lupini]|uniref:Uncharacterized protein n=1 Tax=Cohnella lupini TaxID=1294267 RepID=A0A3D9IFH7_9BACL|nr:hypothetical protein DFP95_10698 [Cohnella lupini]